MEHAVSEPNHSQNCASVLVRLLLLGCFIFPAELLASEDLSVPPAMVEASVQSTAAHGDRYFSFNLVKHLQLYHPEDTQDQDDGLRLFGNQGVAIRISNFMPESTYNCLLAGSGGRAGNLGEDDLNQAFVFAQKRW